MNYSAVHLPATNTTLLINYTPIQNKVKTKTKTKKTLYKFCF